MGSAKQVVVSPAVPRSRLAGFLSELRAEGVRTVHAEPAAAARAGLESMWASPSARHVILEGAARARRGRRAGRRFRIRSNRDIDAMVAEAEAGLDFVIVEVGDWKIIPLENTIARLHRARTRVLAQASTPREVRKMLSVLDVGVDGVVFSASSVAQVREAMLYTGARSFRLRAARVSEVREVGDGERVCVDTASILRAGEGMLVGSRSNFMFLVHNESVGSSFTSPRPFRVNAGAVHCYTPGPDGSTRYLSEVEAGSEVLVLGPGGRARRAAVGRCKIERRPMLMIKAEAGGEVGGIIAQDAETVRLVRPGGGLVSVTHLRRGDRVLVHSGPAAGRHFGAEVAGEYILEK